MLENIIVSVILVAIIGAAVWYIIKAKKSGAKCIGCPHTDTCKSKEQSGGYCSCCGKQDN